MRAEAGIDVVPVCGIRGGGNISHKGIASLRFRLIDGINSRRKHRLCLLNGSRCLMFWKGRFRRRGVGGLRWRECGRLFDGDIPFVVSVIIEFRWITVRHNGTVCRNLPIQNVVACLDCLFSYFRIMRRMELLVFPSVFEVKSIDSHRFLPFPEMVNQLLYLLPHSTRILEFESRRKAVGIEEPFGILCDFRPRCFCIAVSGSQCCRKQICR